MAEKNPFPGENNTGHIWDDNLRELANPPPRWWMIAFWASLAWWVIYGFIYPMWPIGHEPTKGLTGWTQMKEYQQAMAEVQAVRAPFEEKIAGMNAAQILQDAGLVEYVQRAGKVLFGDNCSACHGGGGQGGPDYPVLADDDWLFGGAIEAIEQSITTGRKGVMTAYGKMLEPEEVNTLAAYTVGLSKGQNDPAGQALFLQKGCIACHGMDGKGMHVLGSANLTDSIWRFVPGPGQTELDSAKYTIIHGVNDSSDLATRQAEMPAFGGRLSKDDIKKLAVYVRKMSGGA